jgi:hypothetical protein
MFDNFPHKIPTQRHPVNLFNKRLNDNVEIIPSDLENDNLVCLIAGVLIEGPGCWSTRSATPADVEISLIGILYHWLRVFGFLCSYADTTAATIAFLLVSRLNLFFRGHFFHLLSFRKQICFNY